jgi:DNA-binding transcriptional LysR family regulator
MNNGVRRKDLVWGQRAGAVVEGGSLVRAAELIGITDSGVSRTINRLETRLGVRLLDRTTRSVSLTDEGRRFYEEVEQHLDAVEDAATIASSAVSAVRGPLKVDIDPFFPSMVLGGRLRVFFERYPELSIEFISRERVGDLVSKGVDLAVRFGQPSLSTLVSPKLIEAPVLTVASPGYIERYGKPGHPSDVRQHRSLLFIDPHTGKPYDWEFVRGAETIEVLTSGPLIFSDSSPLIHRASIRRPKCVPSLTSNRQVEVQSPG